MANMTHRVINSVLLSGETTLLMNDKNKSKRPLSERELRNVRYFNKKNKRRKRKNLQCLQNFLQCLQKFLQALQKLRNAHRDFLLWSNPTKGSATSL